MIMVEEQTRLGVVKKKLLSHPLRHFVFISFFFFQAEDGIRDVAVTGVQTCALPISCTRCGGTGKLRTPCRTCGGEGRVRRTETIDVRIPAGVANGGRVRVPGKGNSGKMGAPSGDLYLRGGGRGHEFFERRGNDLFTKIPVKVSEATVGGEIEVPTIDGRAIVRIPP